MWNAIAAQISQVTGQPFQITAPRSVGGGCINQGYRVSDGGRSYFVKLNQATQVAMFAAEAAGLREISGTQTIRVPVPVCHGTIEQSAYLVLEWLDLRSGGASWAALGDRLAAMHRVTSSHGFGWQQDNTIGSTPQPNPWTSDWTEFWVQHRLGHQLRLAQHRGGQFPQAARLLDTVADRLAGHHPIASLVHGDLWSGNAAMTAAGEPVIFDPATYYGDREVDLAMTELFGGFPREFYQGYDRAFPRDGGYADRKPIYNLYHLLNHFNLFGGGYEAQANRTIAQILA
jgi:fructosamine-3-kinase